MAAASSRSFGGAISISPASPDVANQLAAFPDQARFRPMRRSISWAHRNCLVRNASLAPPDTSRVGELVLRHALLIAQPPQLLRKKLAPGRIPPGPGHIAELVSFGRAMGCHIVVLQGRHAQFWPRFSPDRGPTTGCTEWPGVTHTIAHIATS
jgi:hypothetical protein